MTQQIQEDSFSSDTDFETDEGDSEASSTDIDAKLEQEDVFDIDFFKCYSALKEKDQKIYDQSVKFFEERSSGSESEPENGEKLLEPSYMKQSVPRMTLLDHQLAVDGDELDDKKIVATKHVSQSHYEKELEDIKKNIAKISEDVDSDSNDELLTSSSKKKLESLMDKVDDEEVGHLKQIWGSSGQLSEEENFLRDYIINKRYLGAETNRKKGKDEEGFFSKNLDELSDVESDDQKEERKVDLHSQETDFDRIARIPRNATKTIRDLVEKQEKKEKRLKKLKKEKKRKRVLKDADCEDVVGDLPTRFHYQETEPNDYGLSAQELLMATDEELDKWISLKDAIRLRSNDEERELKHKYEAKRNDINLKKSIFKSVYGDDGDSAELIDSARDYPEGGVSTKRSRMSSADEKSVIQDANDDKNSETELKRKKKKRKRGVNHKKFAKAGVAPDRLLAYGISKNKLKKASLL